MKSECVHETFLDNHYNELDKTKLTDREKHCLATELFVYLHNGNDYCDCKREQISKDISELENRIDEYVFEQKVLSVFFACCPYKKYDIEKAYNECGKSFDNLILAIQLAQGYGRDLLSVCKEIIMEEENKGQEKETAETKKRYYIVYHFRLLDTYVKTIDEGFLSFKIRVSEAPKSHIGFFTSQCRTDNECRYIDKDITARHITLISWQEI